MKKKLLIYAHYYIPDVASTGQILHELAEGMIDTFDITVICVVPSYGGHIEERYKTKQFYREEVNGVHVLRIRVPEFTKSSKKSRIKNIATYFIGARMATQQLKEPFDYVFTISQPPLMGGMLGVYGKRKLRTIDGKHPALIYNIQDLNPEQIIAVGYFRNKMVLKAMMAIDKYSCRKSDLIITVGRDLVETLRRRFSGEDSTPKIVMINNWIDEKAVYPLLSTHPKVIEFRKQYGLEDKFVIMYSGNIGLYYDLENLLKVCENFKNAYTPDGREVFFAFVGAGSAKDKLVAYVKEHKMENVIFIPYQDKSNLIYSLNAGDVHWCVNAKRIKGVSCPSKYYGLAAVGKPILGVLERGSEIRCLIEETQGGLVCEPNDYRNVERNITWFINHAVSREIEEMGERAYTYLIGHLTKEISIQKYKEAIIELSVKCNIDNY